MSIENAQINNKTRFGLRSLGIRFVTLTTLILAVTLGTIAMTTYSQDKERLDNELRGRVETLVQFAVKTSVNAVLSYDFGTLNDHMETLTHSPDVIYAVTVTPEDKAMTSYIDKANDYVKVLEETDILRLVDRLESHPDVSLLVYPIIFDGEPIAYINVGVSKRRIFDETQSLFQFRLLFVIVIITLLGILIYFVFRYSALMPIDELSEGAKRVKQGILNKTVTIYNNDELGELARAFNEMMDSLRSNIQEKDNALDKFLQLNKTLEARVERRTKELEDANKNLERLALYDSLTGLPNRALLSDRFSSLLKTSERSREAFSVIMLDLNRFKEVNDSLGHDSGDTMLIEVGVRITRILRKSDTIGRLGGDEFEILLPKTDVSGAEKVASNIIEVLEKPLNLKDLSLPIGASIGIATYPEHGESCDQLIKSADIAMYYAKNNHSGFRAFDPNVMESGDPKTLGLTGELKRAIEEDELVLHYQPQKDLSTGRIVGVEALVRWIHPTKGMIPPGDFIPLAENTGLIKPLTNWVFNAAIRQWSLWSESGIDLRISVNVSAQNLEESGFSEFLSNVMSEHKMRASALCIELTENTVMKNTDLVRRVLSQLSLLGVEISIDDFGTGYSSLSLLKELPVQEIKIDRSFVMDMVNDANDLTIVKSIINIAQTMNLRVVAEGVEDQECEDRLKKLTCDTVQGFHISRPCSFSELESFLKMT